MGKESHEMKIVLLSDHRSKIEQIAEWYFDEWLGANSSAKVENVAESIRTKLGSQETIPLFYIALDEDELAGVIELKFRENKSYPEYEHWLGGLYVKAEYRGKGVGTMLVRKVKAHAQRSKLPRLYLQCEEKLIGMYVDLGFKALHSARHGDTAVTILVWDESQQMRT